MARAHITNSSHNKFSGKGTKNLSKIKVKKPHRFKPGTVALREIRKYQKLVTLLIKKAPFRRLVREIVEEVDTNYRIQESAFVALQEGLEAHTVKKLENANCSAIHAKRVTAMSKDLDLVNKIQQKN